MMLAYFPGIYPGELLYSVLGRLGHHEGILSPKHMLSAVFGSRQVRAAAFLQPHLGLLAANIPPLHGLPAQRLAQETGLLPYFTAYQPQDVRDWALMALTDGNRDADAVHLRLGLVASNVRLPSALRFCRTCRIEMLARHGELYWRRDHQLPGVLLCHTHGTPLADSQVVIAHAGQHVYVAADEENCPANAALHAWANQPEAIRLLQEITVASATLLIAPPSASSLAQWGEKIQLDLRSRGFGRGSIQIDQRALLDAFLSRFSPILAILPDAAPGDWLEAISRKHRKAFAPLHHILIRLLIDSFPLTTAISPFGDGPWPCRNQLAKHFGQFVITDCRLHKERGKTIGAFRCSCGHSFSTGSESHSRMKILEFCPVFEMTLRQLIVVGASLRGAAKELCVDPNTVLRYVALLGLETPWKARPVRSKLPLIEREKMRATWTNGHADAPNRNRQQLRRDLPAVYAWLYRKDRDWLDSQPPKASGHKPSKPLLNWQSIDSAMAQALMEEAKRLLTVTPPQQITRLALEYGLSQPRWMEKRLHKLPRCRARLSDVIESIEDFQCRRVIWAAEELRRQRLPIQAWRIRRLANLGNRCASKVEKLLSRSANENHICASESRL
jgi:hypothetical protein